MASDCRHGVFLVNKETGKARCAECQTPMPSEDEPRPDASGDVQGMPVALSCDYQPAPVPVFRICRLGGYRPTHVAHSLSDEAQAARREAVARAVSGGAEPENWDFATAAAVLRVLGLGGDS